jgi:hypothetical protein
MVISPQRMPAFRGVPAALPLTQHLNMALTVFHNLQRTDQVDDLWVHMEQTGAINVKSYITYVK